jgi:anti-sigma factor RsiW
MDSFFASNRLSEYIDGQLSSEEASEISAAIAAMR